MIVFSNHRLGPAAELLVSPEVAESLLYSTAAAAEHLAQGRWERELVRWLRRQAMTLAGVVQEIDVGDIAWSPEHFDSQRRFLLDAIDRASTGSQHARAYARWARLIEAHPRDSVQVGRRWMLQPSI
jgi:hypothetical protein